MDVFFSTKSKLKNGKGIIFIKFNLALIQPL